MKHYCVGDFHGVKAAYDKVMEYIEADSGGDYTLYFLGDAMDRGSSGYDIMRELHMNPKVYYLRGNHEDLFRESMLEFAHLQYEDYPNYSKREVWKALGNDASLVMDYGNDMRLHMMNGGASTFQAWAKNGFELIVPFLSTLPYKISYRHYDLCHAGCSIEEWDNNDKVAMTWSRDHFDLPWKEGRILVHSHTPIKYLPVFHNRKGVYCEGTKIDMDQGVYETGRISILDMDNDKIILFNIAN